MPVQGSGLYKQSQPCSPCGPISGGLGRHVLEKPGDHQGSYRAHRKSTSFVIRPGWTLAPRLSSSTCQSTSSSLSWTPSAPEAQGQRGAAPPGLARRQPGTGTAIQQHSTNSSACTSCGSALLFSAREGKPRETSEPRPPGLATSVCRGVSGGSLVASRGPREAGDPAGDGDGQPGPWAGSSRDPLDPGVQVPRVNLGFRLECQAGRHHQELLGKNLWHPPPHPRAARGRQTGPDLLVLRPDSFSSSSCTCLTSRDTCCRASLFCSRSWCTRACASSLAAASAASWSFSK